MFEARESDAVSLWDDAAFKARVERLATERGLSLRQVCRGAGLSVDYLHKPASKAGRSVEALMRIAKEMRVDFLDLIGAGAPADNFLATDERLSKLAMASSIAAHLCVALGARGSAPASAVEMAETILKMTGLDQTTGNSA